MVSWSRKILSPPTAGSAHGTFGRQRTGNEYSRVQGRRDFYFHQSTDLRPVKGSIGLDRERYFREAAFARIQISAGRYSGAQRIVDRKPAGGDMMGKRRRKRRAIRASYGTGPLTDEEYLHLDRRGWAPPSLDPITSPREGGSTLERGRGPRTRNKVGRAYDLVKRLG